MERKGKKKIVKGRKEYKGKQGGKERKKGKKMKEKEEWNRKENIKEKSQKGMEGKGNKEINGKEREDRRERERERGKLHVQQNPLHVTLNYFNVQPFPLLVLTSSIIPPFLPSPSSPLITSHLLCTCVFSARFCPLYTHPAAGTLQSRRVGDSACCRKGSSG